MQYEKLSDNSCQKAAKNQKNQTPYYLKIAIKDMKLNPAKYHVGDFEGKSLQ